MPCNLTIDINSTAQILNYRRVLILLEQEGGEKNNQVNNQAFLENNTVITLYVFYNGNQRNLLGIKYLNIL